MPLWKVNSKQNRKRKWDNYNHNWLRIKKTRFWGQRLFLLCLKFQTFRKEWHIMSKIEIISKQICSKRRSIRSSKNMKRKIGNRLKSKSKWKRTILRNAIKNNSRFWIPSLNNYWMKRFRTETKLSKCNYCKHFRLHKKAKVEKEKAKNCKFVYIV